MVAVFALIFLLCLYKIKFSFKEGFPDYLSAQKTGSIKGIFVLIVLFSHMRQYVTFDRSLALNNIFYLMLFQIGQLMVVMFFFYSGYGIMQSIEKKKTAYVRSLPKRRILKTYIHFAVTIVIFLIVNYCLGTTFPIKRIILSFLAWSAVGNSAWFMFAIFMMYIVTYLSFLIAKEHRIAGTVAVTVIIIAYVIVFWQLKGDKEHWWFDTALCYPLGMWYSIAKPWIDRKLLPSLGKWLAAFAASLVALGALHILYKGQHPDNRFFFLFEALALAVTISLFSMRVCIDNKILRWCGARVFSIYMLQRIPMMILSHFGVNEYPYVFAVSALAATLAVSQLFDMLMARLDKRLKL